MVDVYEMRITLLAQVFMEARKHILFSIEKFDFVNNDTAKVYYWNLFHISSSVSV